MGIPFLTDNILGHKDEITKKKEGLQDSKEENIKLLEGNRSENTHLTDQCFRKSKVSRQLQKY